jgi:hypothetical protein
VTTVEEREEFTSRVPPLQGFLPPEHELPESPSVALGRKLFKHDAVQQRLIVPEVGTTAGLNLLGLGATFPGYSICPLCFPPDTNAAVGATQVVETVNLSYQVFDKTTGAAVGSPVALTSLFATSQTSCGGTNEGPPGFSAYQADPIVKYDQLDSMWVITFIAANRSNNKTGPIVVRRPFRQCIAVSFTADATSPYRGYIYDLSDACASPSTAGCFNDYDKLSVWSDAFYGTWNEFIDGAGLDGVTACAFMKPAPFLAVCFLSIKPEWSLLPSDLDGGAGVAGSTQPPPTGSPNYLVGTLNGINSFNLFKFHVDFRTPGDSTLTGPTPITVAPYSEPDLYAIPQPGTGGIPLLASLGDRLMFRNAYRNFVGKTNQGHEALVISHTIESVNNGNTPCGEHSTHSDSGTVRWYEIRNFGLVGSGAPVVFQQGTFTPTSDCRWTPSIGMDKEGDIALGYSITNGNTGGISPSVRYTGRTPSDPLGTMESEATIVTGSGFQPYSVDRWGDYSSMAIDPTDDCTFWYAQEYTNSTASLNWFTRLASFHFTPQCGP